MHACVHAQHCSETCLRIRSVSQLTHTPDGLLFTLPITLGSPPQPLAVVLDTGSADMVSFSCCLLVAYSFFLLPLLLLTHKNHELYPSSMELVGHMNDLTFCWTLYNNYTICSRHYAILLLLHHFFPFSMC